MFPQLKQIVLSRSIHLLSIVSNIFREYEEKIQEIKRNYGKEKANKAKLEKELSKVQEERNRQLLTVDEKKETAMESETSAEVSHQQANLTIRFFFFTNSAMII